MPKQKKPRIAYFASSMIEEQDGVTRVLYKLADYLEKEKIEYLFVTASKTKKKRKKIHGVPSIPFPLNKSYPLAIPSEKYFSKKIKAFKPDIIHIHSPCPLGYSAAKYANKHKIPVVATYHTHFASYAEYYKLDILKEILWDYLRLIYNKCDKIYVPTQAIKEELEKQKIRNLEVLPHGVDTKKFNPKHKNKKWKEKHKMKNKKVVLFAGRLVWEKDLKTLAETYNKILKKRKDVQLAIAGEGPARKEFEKIAGNAKFLGKLTGKDLSQAYASSDIFLFPSTTETFGNVVLEAMASGIPVVCADKGGVKSIVKQAETGLLAKPKDAEDFTVKTIDLLDNKKLNKKIKKNALAHAKKQEWKKIFDKMIENYNEIIKEKSAK